jgi:polyhydroxybutyrate depolymerase|tara:strand:- start:19234 stop:20340 length:1107 start_codon:yes stop_codon:yes gene_type:complete
MKKIFLSLILSLISVVALAQLTTHTMNVGGVTRNYYKYLPVNYQATENLPVVFILHGLGGNAQQMTLAGFSLIADTARIIAIYPDGLQNTLGQTAWNNGTLLSSTADDVGFFNKMMDLMLTNQNANPSRIYVTGFSMGGIMTHHLACALNNRIAAIGPMAGTMSTDDIANCVPAYKTPVIHLHGTADATVPYNSGALPSLSLVPETMNFWKGVHGCSATADSTRIPDTAADGITIDRFVYDNCNPIASVELWRLNGADHIYLYQPVNDITEAVEIWKFFNKWQHPNPQAVSVNELAKEKSFSIYPNPSTGQFAIQLSQKASLSLFDISGNRIQTFELNSGKSKINLNLSPGVYLLKDESGSTERLIIQ